MFAKEVSFASCYICRPLHIATLYCDSIPPLYTASIPALCTVAPYCDSMPQLCTVLPPLSPRHHTAALFCLEFGPNMLQCTVERQCLYFCSTCHARFPGGFLNC